jgi:hypothetical protein
MPIKSFDLKSDREQIFADDGIVCVEWAVAYPYAEDNRRLSELFSLAQRHPDDLPEQIRKRFPITYGQRSVACGDWAALKPSAAH